VYSERWWGSLYGAQQAGDYLEKAPQAPSKEVEDIVCALGDKAVLSHKDKARAARPLLQSM